VRAVLLAIAVASVAVGLVACGGDDGETAEPLTLEQRVVRDSDAPGSKPDPVETRKTARSLDEFTAFHGTYVRAAEISREELEEAGLVAAIHDTRFFPKRTGGPHTPDAPHIRILVVQFESEDGAATGVDLLEDNAFKPCPETCAMHAEGFDVSGPPDAKGIRNSATAERIKELGEEGEPFDSYAIAFADGVFAYEIEGFGPPGAVSETQVEEIAEKVHDRVEGAPPPDA
jgi:hypothetical protein